MEMENTLESPLLSTPHSSSSPPSSPPRSSSPQSPRFFLPHEIVQRQRQNHPTEDSRIDDSGILPQFTDQQKKIFERFFANGHYVSAIEMYYQITNQSLPTSTWMHPFGQYGLTDIQLRDITKVILQNVEAGDIDFSPQSSLASLRGISSPSGIPTVDSAFRALLVQSVHNKVKKAGYVFVTVVVAVVTWVAYVLYPTSKTPSP